MAQKDAGAGKGPPTTRLVFHWATGPGLEDEEVRVVGNHPALGGWDPAQGLLLTRIDAEGYTCWVSKGLVVPLGAPVEYQYAYCQKGTGEFLRFEDKSPNRRVVPTGRRHVLEDDQGRYRLLCLERERLASLAACVDSAASPMARQTSVLAGQDELSDPPLPHAASCPTVPARVTLDSVLKEGVASDVIGVRRAGLPSGLSSGQLSRHLNDVPELYPEDTVFIIFRILPLTVERNEQTGEWMIGGERSNKGAVLPALLHFTRPEAREQGYDCKVRFIGLPGVHVTEQSDKKKITDLLAQHSCIPVFVDKEVEDNHLDFSVNFLWPVFHSQKCFDTEAEDHLPSATFDEAKWKSYQALNNAYAEVIEQRGTRETLVWVQDYQLLLVPRYIYHRCPDWHIGFFLHCAFPSSEVIRCLPNREEILQSMLSCKLVTFQIFDYTRNFLSTISQLLGAKHTFAKGGMLQVEHEGNTCTVTADHFVVPYEHLERHWGKEDVRSMAQNIRAKFPGKTIIGCYDRVDRFAGLCLKVRAFQKFLKEYSGYQGKVVLVQYVTTCTDNGPEDTMALMRDLEQMAQETNQAFQKPGEPPVVNICVEDLDRDKRMALLQAIDVLFDTSVNDGLNLVPFQFYAAHTVDNRGVSVVSEFCGCSRVLTGVFKVNPWDMGAIMVALDQALSIEPGEQQTRFAKDHSYVASQTVVQWVTKNLCELRSSVRSTAGQQASAAGRAGHLNVDHVLESYRSARTRAILVDNEGTIAAKAGWSLDTSDGSMTALRKQGVPPDEHVLDCLQTLAQDRNNTVVVLSGRDPKILDMWFGGVQGVGLCAEHGFHWLPPKSLRPKGSEEVRQWRCLVSGETSEDAMEALHEWKALVIELMKQYVKRVQGSILECKDSAISWNYRGVGAPMVVAHMARELAHFLDPEDVNGVMHGYPVQVVCGKGYVEVKRKDVDKGIAVCRILEMLEQQLRKPVEFVLCIGDDRSDEDMFEAVSRLYPDTVHPQGGIQTSRWKRRAASKEQTGLRLTAEVNRGTTTGSSLVPFGQEEPRSSFTVTVGRKQSKAQWFVHDVHEVSVLLQKLSAQTVITSFSRFASLPNLLGADMPGSDEDEPPPMDSGSGSPSSSHGFQLQRGLSHDA